ncbi:MAG: PadR family transcriptional regulator [Dehalococcoidia bacterium]
MANSPFRSQLDALLLAIIAPAPLHGYAIIERLRERSDGAFELPEGTVYPVLHRLEREGQLASEWAERNGRRTRHYRVTEPGREALAARRIEWQAFRRGVDSILEAS